MLASRGCSYNCSFCAVPTFNKLSSRVKYRYRKVSNIGSEIESLYFIHGIRNISFVDDLFLSNSIKSQKYCIELAREIIKRRLDISFSIECRSDSIKEQTIAILKEAGLKRVFLGIEAGTDSTLAYYNKNLSPADHINAFEVLDRQGIPVSIGYLLFNPMSTVESVKNDLTFLSENQRLRANHLKSKMIAYPGSPIRNAINTASNNNDPEPISYDFNSSLTAYLYKRLESISHSLDTLDMALNSAEYRIAQTRGCEYGKLFFRYREMEKKISALISKLVHAYAPLNNWLELLEKVDIFENNNQEIINQYITECKSI